MLNPSRLTIYKTVIYRLALPDVIDPSINCAESAWLRADAHADASGHARRPQVGTREKEAIPMGMGFRPARDPPTVPACACSALAATRRYRRSTLLTEKS